MPDMLPLTVPGDGGPSKVTVADLRRFAEELKRVKDETGQQLLTRTRDGMATRFCLWSGQSADGRKHKASGSDAFPYEGAPDNRVRLVDFLITYYIGIYMQAMRGASRAVQPMEVTDAGFSGRMQTLLNWILDNLLGDQLPEQLELLLNWMEGDTPALAVAGIYWETDTNTEARKITVDELLHILSPEAASVLRGEGTPPPEGWQDTVDAAVDSTVSNYLQAILSDPERVEEGIRLLRSVAPEIDAPRARAMLKQLAETQSADYYVPSTRFAGPRICAHRIYDDIFFPGYTQHIQRAPCVFVREMLTEVELRERVVTQGYRKAFVDKLIGEPGGRGFSGESFLNETYESTNTILRQAGYNLYEGSEVPWRGHYEVITVWYRAVNAFGTAGVYYAAFSAVADDVAHDRRLSGYAHGKYPFVAFPRERVGRLLVGSRSTAELGLTDQLTLKKLTDTTVIHAETGAMPPIMHDYGVDAVLLGPHARNPVRKTSDIQFLNVPPMPTSMDKVLGLIDVRVAQYFGIPHPGVPPELTQAVIQRKIDNVLAHWREVLVQVLQLAQQYMTPDQLAAVSGGSPGPAITPDDIRHRFNVTISFDARTLSLDWLKELMNFAKELVGLDSQGVVMRERLVGIIARAYGANLADTVIQPVQLAIESERKQVEDDIKGAFAGIMPKMDPDARGINWQVRNQRLQEWEQQNPFAFDRAPADAKQILTQYRDYLEQGATQEVNAVTGKLGTRPDLDVEAVRQQVEDAATAGAAEQEDAS